MNKIQKALEQNRRAKFAGGYRTLDLSDKNRVAESFYRSALDAQFDDFLTSCFENLERVYTVVGSNNAKYIENPDRKPSVFSVQYVIRQFKTTGSDRLTENSEKIVLKFIKQCMRSSGKKARKVLDDAGLKAISIQYDKAYDDLFKLFINRNVALIKNTTEQTLTNIENIVYDGMTTGQGWKDVYQSLKTQRHIAADRIKRIARDQTAKASAALNEVMQKDAGVEYFQWKTAQDERVSTGYGGHRQLNNKIYKYSEENKYPIIDSYGHRGLPSQRVNCRCVALPVIIYDGYKAVWDNVAETYKIVKVK